MTILRAAIFAALFLFASIGHSSAEDVTLTSRDGAMQVVGSLLSFDGEFYRVDTEFGILTLDGARINCDGPGCPDLTAFVAEFTISGARTMGEVLMPALVEAFAIRNGYRIARKIIDDTRFSYELVDIRTGIVVARIAFHVTSTAEGFADLLANEADVVLSMRQATATEIRLAKEAGLGDLSNPRRSKIVALDGMVPIVAAQNLLDGLTLSELAQIFGGRITKWSEIGGVEAPIKLHLRDELSGLLHEFQRRVVGQGQALAPEIIRHASNNGLSDAVARDPLAIGIATYSEIGNAKPLLIKGGCDILSVVSATTLKTEDYPLTAPLFIYTPLRRLPVLAREFLLFIRSNQAQPVVERAGFVDLRITEVDVAAQGLRLSNAISFAGDEVGLADLQRLTERMHGTTRLSLNFRFATGGTQLDAQSRSNVDILAEQLEDGRFAGRKIVFVGFSDSEGSAAGNLRLARRRAETVSKAVLRTALTVDEESMDVSVDAFGEAMPMACDDADWGRRINRRVEVWVD